MMKISTHSWLPLQISPATVKNYLRRLEDFYLTFSIRPYSKNIKRSLLKAGKYYLYDWTRIKNKGPRFENYVACELKALVTLWGDASGSLGLGGKYFLVLSKP